MNINNINVGTTYVGLLGQTFTVSSAEHGRASVKVKLQGLNGAPNFSTVVHTFSTDEWRWQ